MSKVIRKIIFVTLLLSAFVFVAFPSHSDETVANWFIVKNIAPDIYAITEPEHVTFYLLKDGKNGLFIDTGLGLSDELSRKLLEHFEIEQFDVLLTHAHADHVGMNHLANKIYMHAEEWEKYLSQHEVAQVTQYHALFSGPEVPWPKGVHPRTAAPEWSPSELFNKDQQDIRIGPWLLKATRLPGHTRGHMVYHETKNSFYFAGDLIYDGAIYLHLADSSLSEYIVSLERLNEMLTRSKDLNVKPTLFPSHNTIPLDDGYVPLTLQFARDVSASKIAPTVEKTWKKDSFFCEGFFFERGYTPAPVKMYLNSEIWKKIQNVKP